MKAHILRGLNFTIRHQHHRILHQSGHHKFKKTEGLYRRLYRFSPSLLFTIAFLYSHSRVFAAPRFSSVFLAPNDSQKQTGVYAELRSIKADIPAFDYIRPSRWFKWPDMRHYKRIRHLCLAVHDPTWVRPICNFFSFYALSLAYLARHKSSIKAVICNTDVSPEIAALCIAANQTGIPVLCAQSSLLHKKPLPFMVSAGILSNESGWEIFKNSRAKNAIILQRQEPLPFIRGSVTDRPQNIGIALNNFFDRGKLSAAIKYLKMKHPDAAINIRRHPNCTEDISAYPAADIKGSLQDFARLNDFIICGNSNVQIDLLRWGCPVAHTALENMRFDTCRFVENGVVFGCEALRDFDIANLNGFYLDPAWHENILKRFSVPGLGGATQNPAALKEWLANLSHQPRQSGAGGKAL